MSQTIDGGGAGPTRPATEQSTNELVQHVGEQFSRLAREELMLARIELMEKGRHAGRGAGFFGGGGVLALYGVGALVLAAVLGLAVVVPGWLAALIVGVALLLVAGVMALVGRRQVKQAVPPTPASVTENMRADVDTVTSAVRERGRA